MNEASESLRRRATTSFARLPAAVSMSSTSSSSTSISSGQATDSRSLRIFEPRATTPSLVSVVVVRLKQARCGRQVAPFPIGLLLRPAEREVAFGDVLPQTFDVPNGHDHETVEDP